MDNESAQAQNLDTTALNYEQAREELVSVVSKLEAGGASLEESLALWERGEALAKRCEEWLEGAKARLAKARADVDASGDPSGT
ncbi:exodeoxyribonuclease VII small subunit [Paenarthrobacter sp. Z7-10]|uniref:exodeoxyribonuclease VII small subunit n=1 Tax=Paenarthrobacter sp. Z7-10 TaxID=2787635 RepID=UPI0022A9345B|nr:exodeoxyribonuclease VII small subunit [Paenarthrobacter sp. Z7-10]MCZ2403278.1 exodeoxyribonuclease VII small subunit [Paenarthrobacter sp. Z7-10]